MHRTKNEWMKWNKINHFRLPPLARDQDVKNVEIVAIRNTRTTGTRKTVNPMGVFIQNYEQSSDLHFAQLFFPIFFTTQFNSKKYIYIFAIIFFRFVNNTQWHRAAFSHSPITLIISSTFYYSYTQYPCTDAIILFIII